MSDFNIRSTKAETRAVHAGQHADEKTGALVEPVYMTSTFTFTEDRLDRWIAGDTKPDEIIYTYGRSRNPTQVALQEKIAALEEAEAALVTASGMSAIHLAILGYCKQGDHIICARTVYGGTYSLFDHILPDFGITVTFVDSMEPEALDNALQANTKVVYFEAVSNPTLDIPDFDVIVGWAKHHNVHTIVDNTFPTPYLFQPIKWGIDTVIHSTTKYINGHGDLVGGVIVGTKKYCESLRSNQYLETGPVQAPMNCYFMLRGLKTLHLRVQRHCENAMALAQHLEQHPKVARVLYPGLLSNPNHERAKKYFSDFGGMLSFEIKGGIAEAKKVIFSLNLAYFAVSLGDCDTLVQLPAYMTHRMVPKADREKMGIADSMIRVSVGIEHIEDLIADFDQALEKY